MKKRKLQLNSYYHIYNRAVSKRKIFKTESDYRYFMHRIAVFKVKYKIHLIIFNVLPNHYHILVKFAYENTNIPMFMKSLQQSYAIYYNRKYKHSGHVFQGTYRHKFIDSEEYLSWIIQYIKNNAVKHGLVKKAEDWPYLG